LYLRLKSLPGVSPRPPFGLILDSTGDEEREQAHVGVVPVPNVKDQQVTHTHTDREQHPRHRHTHAHDENNTPNEHLPQAFKGALQLLSKRSK